MNKQITIIAGPCVIETMDVLEEVAQELVRLNRKYDLSIIFKASFDKANRTSIHSYRGPGLEKGLQMLADVKSIAKRNQQLAAKGYAGHNYREEGLFSAEADNVHLEGYRFSYDLQDFRQKAETLLMKYEKMIYNFTCVSREESAAEGSELFRNLIDVMKLD